MIEAHEDRTLHSLLTGAAFISSGKLARIRVTGEDRSRWLNGMTTNSVAKLAVGDACYTFFLNAQGRIQGDATVLAYQDHLEIETARDRVALMIEMLDRYIIMDDVELQAAADPQACLRVAGPAAAKTLAEAGLTLAPPGPLHFTTNRWRGAEVEVLQQHSPLVVQFEVWSDSATLAALTEAFAASDIVAGTPAGFEQLRMLEGTPLYGTDIRDRDLPQETGQTRALSFSKGCYLGQEIVERIHSRGNVHRTFSGFLLKGELPGSGVALAAEGAPEKAVGELTSVGRLSLGSGTIQMGLGYVRREAVERLVRIVYPGGEATPAALPYLQALTG